MLAVLCQYARTGLGRLISLAWSAEGRFSLHPPAPLIQSFSHHPTLLVSCVRVLVQTLPPMPVWPKQAGSSQPRDPFELHAITRVVYSCDTLFA